MEIFEYETLPNIHGNKDQAIKTLILELYDTMDRLAARARGISYVPDKKQMNADADDFVERLQERQLTLIAAVTDDHVELMGLCTVSMFKGDPLLNDLIVDKTFRGHGVASRLIKEAEIYSRNELKCRYLRINALANNKQAVAMYGKRFKPYSINFIKAI